MKFSIFHSEPIPDWSRTSKALDRLDVEGAAQAKYEAHELLKKGHTVHAILEGYKEARPMRQHRTGR